MSYPVVFSQQAARELEEAADWWATHRDPAQAVRWYSGFSEKIVSVGEDPERFPPADENDDFPYTIRELNYGLSSRPTHRAIFTITQENVVVLTVRHIARDRLTLDDISEPQVDKRVTSQLTLAARLVQIEKLVRIQSQETIVLQRIIFTDAMLLFELLHQTQAALDVCFCRPSAGC